MFPCRATEVKRGALLFAAKKGKTSLLIVVLGVQAVNVLVALKGRGVTSLGAQNIASYAAYRGWGIYNLLSIISSN